jgi:transcriptional regulator with XRE-family HTH domain
MTKNPIRERRLERGWSRDDLSDASRVSYQALRYIEGGYVPSPLVRAALALALGTAEAELFPGIEESGR